MECDDDGIERVVPTAGKGVFRRKRKVCGEGFVRLAFTAAVSRATSVRPESSHTLPLYATPLPPSASLQPNESPFMNNMDEISYWIYTKRAPCLLNYDNIVKKQVEQAQCSTTKPPDAKVDDEPTPKKKRKLKLLDDDSVSSEKQQNVYFKAPQNQNPNHSSYKSNEGPDINININIKTSKVPKNKTMKTLRNSQIQVPIKNKVSTSTPKIVNLRRSLRKAQQNYNSSCLNSSFEIFSANIVNGKRGTVEPAAANRADNVAENDHSKSKAMLRSKRTNEVLNGQFEDLSDVSGFTANYIRSTKVHSSKRPQKLRNPNHSKEAVQHSKMIMCINKSMNTDFPASAALHCSTDSSENALKLVTITNNQQHRNRNAALIKLLEAKIEDSNDNIQINKKDGKNNLNISFQSKSSGASRYPRRNKNNTPETAEPNCSVNINRSTTNTGGKCSKVCKLNVGNSNEKDISRTRSGRRRGLKLDVDDAGRSMLQLNTSIEQVSSGLNVACANKKSPKKNNITSRCLRSRTIKGKVGQLCQDSASDGSNKKLSDGIKCALEQSTSKCVRKNRKTADKTRQSLRDSLRDKSGFAACFSDSDSDSEPLKRRKFFC